MGHGTVLVTFRAVITREDSEIGRDWHGVTRDDLRVGEIIVLKDKRNAVAVLF